MGEIMDIYIKEEKYGYSDVVELGGFVDQFMQAAEIKIVIRRGKFVAEQTFLAALKQTFTKEGKRMLMDAGYKLMVPRVKEIDEAMEEIKTVFSEYDRIYPKDYPWPKSIQVRWDDKFESSPNYYHFKKSKCPYGNGQTLKEALSQLAQKCRLLKTEDLRNW